MNKSRILRWWAYFRRAHSVYFVYLLSFTNFVTITYTLLFVRILGFPADATHYLAYAAVFLLSYAAAAIAVGRWDYRRGAVPVEGALAALANPYTQDMLLVQEAAIEALQRLLRGDEETLKRLEEAKKIIRRWRAEASHAKQH